MTHEKLTEMLSYLRRDAIDSLLMQSSYHLHSVSILLGFVEEKKKTTFFGRIVAIQIKRILN